MKISEQTIWWNCMRSYGNSIEMFSGNCINCYRHIPLTISNSRCELSRRNNFRKRHKEAIFQGTMVILKKEMDQQNVMWIDEMMCLATPDILLGRTTTKMLASWGLIVRGCFTGGVLPCLTIVNGTLTALTCQEVIECDLTQI